MVELVRTCLACPEQYDAYIDGQKVGYLRLRHGWFRAEYRGDIVYESNPRGDGAFESDERHAELNAAARAIRTAHWRNGRGGDWKPEPEYAVVQRSTNRDEE